MINHKELYEFKHIIYSCYTKDLAYHDVKEKWNDENKSLGQDAITAILIRDHFGGSIKRCYIEEIDYYHFFNLIDKEVIDITKEQFNDKITINYDDAKTKYRTKLLEIVDLKNRYDTLCKEIKQKSDKLYTLKNILTTDFKNSVLYFNEDCKYFVFANDYISLEQIENNTSITDEDKKYLIENANKISYLI
ncbi:MAG: hypothetical protein ACI4TX_05135, partial [Christensenellales bacterium]